MKTIKLAIVDDHLLFRQGLSHILRRFAGHEIVLEAASADELFAQLEVQHPDVVLLDLHMPGMDGRQASTRLLALLPHIKIIILSMEYSPEFILELMRVGVHGYLPKDIDQEILVEAIHQVYTKGFYIDDTVAQVMREGLQAKHSNVPQSQPYSVSRLLFDLTRREKEVLTLLCEGYSSAQIAEKLFISFRTVEGHRKNLLEKTGATNAVSLAMFAVKHHLLDSL
ncbi:response regulator transcription factor [Hymenobacter swuensis]|uniref:Uncharacterized protein n=1 Tax=Hymenobacter swuensis DY53 TaxID=1227739 RepID=W8F8T9_9BACT|nr:response regulator transcription factor [Hymenobacter swuensis]AHJ98135.1 hypothetical protein Hsw_2540 [Hymenobacter swuensis DY53]